MVDLVPGLGADLEGIFGGSPLAVEAEFFLRSGVSLRAFVHMDLGAGSLRLGDEFEAWDSGSVVGRTVDLSGVRKGDRLLVGGRFFEVIRDPVGDGAGVSEVVVGPGGDSPVGSDPNEALRHAG